MNAGLKEGGRSSGLSLEAFSYSLPHCVFAKINCIHKSLFRLVNVSPVNKRKDVVISNGRMKRQSFPNSDVTSMDRYVGVLSARFIGFKQLHNFVGSKNFVPTK